MNVYACCEFVSICLSGMARNSISWDLCVDHRPHTLVPPQGQREKEIKLWEVKEERKKSNKSTIKLEKYDVL